MPRPSCPWFRVSTNSWYIKVEGKQISLGVAGEANEAQAVKAWHRLMASDDGGLVPSPVESKNLKGESERGLSGESPKPSTFTIRQLADAFLADCEA